MILLVVPALLLLFATMCISLPRLRRRRMAPELRSDWWPRFERGFDAYASRSWQVAREGERKA
jgi:amino acid transporter